ARTAASTKWSVARARANGRVQRVNRQAAAQRRLSNRCSVAIAKTASVSIDESIDRGMAIARKIDAVVRNLYSNNAAVPSEWITALHVERGPKRKRPRRNRRRRLKRRSEE